MSGSARFLRVWTCSTSVSEYGSYGVRAFPASQPGIIRWGSSRVGIHPGSLEV
jgi:hypothetical protein